MAKKNYAAEHDSNLLWLDLEMTGLDPASDRIIEMALIATDQNLEIIARSPSWVISCPDDILDGMDDWNKRTHGKSGLLAEVRQSQLSITQAQQQALIFARKWAIKGRSPMCGSTICQDRRFLSQWMPELESYFHYRNFDVSSFKLAAIFFKPELVAFENQDSDHRAVSDIEDSIAEMRHYRKAMLSP
ncbi:MAG: oligoribonuclease [Betaproteobacteria bacterium]|nr:oligoribonuclease [Betaproteobacteria bacterium]